MHCHFAPLGIPALVRVDDPALAAAVEAAYADWILPHPAEAPRIVLTLEQGGSPSTEVSLGIRVCGSRLTLQGAGISGEADADRGTGHCVLPHWTADGAALAMEAVDTILLFLLARSGRTPVHAAGIVVGNTVLVLAGPSGSGKSTLSLAAQRRGLRLLSDDMVFVQTEPRLCVWGFPRPLHVFPKDAPPGRHKMRLRGGKRKAVVPLAATSERPVAGAAMLILLTRGHTLDLAPLAPNEAITRLSRLEPGFDLLAEQSAAAVAALAQAGAWQLTLADDPGSAIDFLLVQLPVRTPISA